MTGWNTGAATVERLIRDRALQRVPAARDSARASRDAARKADTAVLARQGLRATVKGGHVAVEGTLRAQFEPGFADFHYLRRRRNELEYPSPSDPENSTADEAREALDSATGIVAQAEELVPRLGIF